jgi:class 3 adenylate cyclase/tetratricopeptide (TPR) repeat protein
MRVLSATCRHCKGENPGDNRYCGHCGASLEVACGQCGASNSAAHKFCGQCGSALETGARLSRGEPGARSPAQYGVALVERRQITILFCDLAGSTAMSRALDPERLRDLLSEYRQAVSDMIDEFGGQIARFLGDGILAYFGYPIAHENDAVRAIRAGLGIVRRMSTLNASLQTRFGVNAQVRIGVHTGVVVVGDLATGSISERMSVVGEAPNIAARLQEIARPDSIVVGDLTARLAAGHVPLRSLGKVSLKGVATPLEVFEAAQIELDALQHVPEPSMTRLYGRGRERKVMWDCWLQASAGNGQILVIGGDAGIGKSRLMRDFHDRLAAVPHVWIDWVGSPFAQQTAFAPVIAALRRALAAADPGTHSDMAARLVPVLGTVAETIPESAPLLCELLGLGAAEGGGIEAWTPLRKRRRTLDSLAAWVLSRAEHDPLVLAVEDLHWIDVSTRELLDAVVRQVPRTRLLCLVTHRPETSPAWRGEPGVTALQLEPLSGEEVGLMIGEIAANHALAAPTQRAIASKADGVPLFIEELTRTVLDRDDKAPDTAAPESLPATLRDSLMERLDRLSSPKSILQSAAVIGRTFTYATMRKLVSAEDDVLEGDLEALVRAGILFQHGIPPASSYTFKHSLLRDAAYDSMLLRDRRARHRSLADFYRADTAIEAEQPELVAFHLSASGAPNEAAAYFAKAGRRAVERAAHREALEHIDAALVELTAVPASADRTAAELALHMDRGAVLIALRGYGASEVGKEYETAYALCDESGSPESTYSALWGLGSYFGVRGPLERARELTLKMIPTAEALGDPLRQGEAYRRLGLIAFMLGDMATSRECYGHARQRLEGATSPAAIIFGTRPFPLLLSNQAWLSWYVGQPGRARHEIQNALDTSRRINDPYALAFAQGIHAAIAQMGNDTAAVIEASDECLAISREQYFPYWQAWAEIFGGWARSVSGDGNGLALLEQGLEHYSATGAIQLELCGLTLYAEALMAHDRAADAWSVLEQIDTEKPGTAKYFTPEMWRIKANCARALGQHALMSEAFRRAVEEAARQGSPMLELRALADATRHGALPDATARSRALRDQVQFDPNSWDDANAATPPPRLASV